MYSLVTRITFVAYAPVAQLDRVTGYEPVGQGFESLLAHQSKNPVDLRRWDFCLFYYVLINKNLSAAVNIFLFTIYQISAIIY